MINLLPTDIKQDITYARRNTILRRWIIGAVIALLGVGAIIAGGRVYMDQSIDDYAKQVEVAQTNLQSQNIAQTQKRVNEISANTKLAIDVLSREILFSQLIPKLGTALPPKSSLASLQIDKVQGGLQLNATAEDIGTGTQIQVNLQDPKNGVFEKADINSIDCNKDEAPKPGVVTYPCKVSIRALFSSNNSYTFISPNKGNTR